MCKEESGSERRAGQVTPPASERRPALSSLESFTQRRTRNCSAVEDGSPPPLLKGHSVFGNNCRHLLLISKISRQRSAGCKENHAPNSLALVMHCDDPFNGERVGILHESQFPFAESTSTQVTCLWTKETDSAIGQKNIETKIATNKLGWNGICCRTKNVSAQLQNEPSKRCLRTKRVKTEKLPDRRR